MKPNRIYNMDCLDGMAKIAAESIDLVVTDPPYGIEFMNKDWDRAIPAIPIWQECLRVLKPGAFAFVMSGPRLDMLWRMGAKLEEAGFVTGFTPIFWVFATGFPKAANISKLIDKRAGAEGEVLETVSYERKSDASFAWQDGQHRSEAFKAGGHTYEVRAPATPEAQALEGAYAGFQPKPAVELILVVMKPLSEPTYVDQALQNGKGATWLEEGRIPFENKEDMESSRFGTQTDIRGGGYGTKRPSEGDVYRKDVLSSTKGRFAPNLLVSDDMLNTGQAPNQGHWAHAKVTGYGSFGGGTQEYYGVGPKGSVDSYSKYFSLDAWWVDYIDQLPEEARRTFPCLVVPKPSKSEKNQGLNERDHSVVNDGRKKAIDNPFQRGKTPRRNTHPTVKPIQLMSYLVAIGSRPKDIVLDPFIGSGTTAIACRLSLREFIGFEISKEYYEIARARLRPYMEQRKLDAFLGGS